VDEEEADDSELLGINVLDIYGFEVFERGNGFEQFLINCGLFFFLMKDLFFPSFKNA
jgi:hypothetical protein